MRRKERFKCRQHFANTCGFHSRLFSFSLSNISIAPSSSLITKLYVTAENAHILYNTAFHIGFTFVTVFNRKYLYLLRAILSKLATKKSYTNNSYVETKERRKKTIKINKTRNKKQLKDFLWINRNVICMRCQY